MTKIWQMRNRNSIKELVSNLKLNNNNPVVNNNHNYKFENLIQGGSRMLYSLSLEHLNETEVVIQVMAVEMSGVLFI